jgi:hypothetical protein
LLNDEQDLFIAYMDGNTSFIVSINHFMEIPNVSPYPECLSAKQIKTKGKNETDPIIQPRIPSRHIKILPQIKAAAKEEMDFLQP